MTITDTSTIEPWMTELWAWADKFDISVEELPRNKEDLLEITDLNISSNQLIYLPDSIGQLKNLEKLKISSSHLKQIPETIGQLTGLTQLTLNCESLEYFPDTFESWIQLRELTFTSDKIKQFPKLLAHLTHLRMVDFPIQLIDQVPINIIEGYFDNGLWIKSIPFTMLYKPLADYYRLSDVGFFVIDDGWSEKSLIDLKYKIGSGALFGLQTTNTSINKFDEIEGIIICEPNEVQQVITVFESVLLGWNKRGIDAADIRRACGADKPAKFIQTSVVATPGSNQEVNAINRLLSQIPKGLSIEYMMLDIESDHELTLDEFFNVTAPIENRDTDFAEVFYGNRFTESTGCCWIGAIYVAG